MFPFHSGYSHRWKYKAISTKLPYCKLRISDPGSTNKKFKWFYCAVLEVQIKSSSGFIMLFFSQLDHPQKPLLYPARESPHNKRWNASPTTQILRQRSMCVCVLQQTHLFLHLRKWQIKYFYLLLWGWHSSIEYTGKDQHVEMYCSYLVFGVYARL